MTELVDVPDLKSGAGFSVRVRFPLAAPCRSKLCIACSGFFMRRNIDVSRFRQRSMPVFPLFGDAVAESLIRFPERSMGFYKRAGRTDGFFLLTGLKF